MRDVSVGRLSKTDCYELENVGTSPTPPTTRDEQNKI
nr:MAG TPA: hypothetical protein [Caudoviricetes sp.]